MAAGGAAARPGALGAREAAVAGGAAALLVLNVIDGLFTTAFLQLGVAAEANPLMRMAYERSPLTFMVAKLALVQLGVAVLWFHRDARAARVALGLGVLLYSGIVGWHLFMLASVLAG